MGRPRGSGRNMHIGRAIDITVRLNCGERLTINDFRDIWGVSTRTVYRYLSDIVRHLPVVSEKLDSGETIYFIPREYRMNRRHYS